jgi:alpha-L-rhamnosidase
VLVAPQPGGGLTWARASLETGHGPVAVSWQQDPAGGFALDVDLPADVGALVRLPDGTEQELDGGSHQLSSH